MKARVFRRILSVEAKFRRDREVKFYFAEFLDEALKSHFYKILKSRLYALKFYARRSFKFRFGSCGPCAAAPNTHHLKFYDRAAEFLRGGALKFYRRAVKKIRITEKFSKTAKFHHTKFRYAIKFYHPKFYLLAKFYRSAEFKRLQYCATSAMPYARRGFCR
ncbi:hypothetical protein [uncultured Campylobacter sp.]|uniref:hypothetical protein n=1 Tax=uncultured Campylobacter sp. TaxID=218934 RepID=UPI0026242754|nr:hypothetical protein [uncultured Campylobacter sp.]